MSTVIRDSKKSEQNLSDRPAPGLDPIHDEFNQVLIRAATATYVKGQDREAGTWRRIEGKVGRNERCPCGSGEKFKRCHYDAAIAGRYR